LVQGGRELSRGEVPDPRFVKRPPHPIKGCGGRFSVGPVYPELGHAYLVAAEPTLNAEVLVAACLLAAVPAQGVAVAVGDSLNWGGQEGHG